MLLVINYILIVNSSREYNSKILSLRTQQHHSFAIHIRLFVVLCNRLPTHNKFAHSNIQRKILPLPHKHNAPLYTYPAHYTDQIREPPIPLTHAHNAHDSPYQRAVGLRRGGENRHLNSLPRHFKHGHKWRAPVGYKAKGESCAVL